MLAHLSSLLALTLLRTKRSEDCFVLPLLSSSHVHLPLQLMWTCSKIRGMRERFVDIALITALVLIAGTIVFTLFGRPLTPRVEAGSQPEETLPNVAEAVAPDVADTITPVLPDQEESAQTSQSEAVQLEETPTETDSSPEVAEIPRQPIPEGAVELERVGFSYVTGGVGACNIVLEPWQHVAVSLDLREQYPCGTEITIELNEEVGGRTTFTAIVADGIRNAERTVNVYVGTDEPALEYGVRDGVLNP
jgi:hypothetical protein